MNFKKNSGARQMATDEAILQARINGQVPNTLRFYTWIPPAITVGFFQSVEQEVDIKKARVQGVDIIRRYTGGGAVFHNQEITYSIALSEKDVSEDILESYEMICSGVVEGLKLLGLEASFSPINDILVNGKKISGSAQTRKEGVVLQHGTIILDLEVEKMFSLLKVSNEKIKDKLIKDVKERVTSVRKEVDKDLDPLEMEKALVGGFKRVFGFDYFRNDLSEVELKMAEYLYKEKYFSDSWNYRR